MNGSGCRNCPVEKCETLNYRGSVCAAQRAKLGLGDPNDRTDCWQFEDCTYRNDVGWCPENCLQYRHEDDVRVVRCEKCSHSLSNGWICGGVGFTMPSHPTYPNSFCSDGERKDDE